MKNSVQSNLFSIKDIMDTRDIFNIPRYQRLYVWEKIQVETLMTDIHTAWLRKKSLFYLGGVIIVKTRFGTNTYDLIDGQQRFTTLWLISLILGLDLSEFTKVNKRSRLSFAIREDVKRYFDETLANREFSDQVDERAEGGSLLKIFKAKTLIKSFLDTTINKDAVKLQSFSRFIAEKVKLLVTEVPDTPHLNKLFEVINNRGIQLQHHEILKAKILEKITKNKAERINYGKIWNACSDMYDYIERTLRDETRISVADCYELNNGVFNFPYLLELMAEQDTSVKPINLSYAMDYYKPVIKIPKRAIDTEEHRDSGEDQFEPIRSILSFPQLLQHTLRIYQHEHAEPDISRINEKELLDSFEPMLKNLNEKGAKEFIELLFRVRVVFDNNIIKWVTVAQNDERHMIKRLSKKNRSKGSRTYFLLREKPKSNESAFALLQSMLYHSQQITTHYWLTPLLYKMLSNRDEQENLNYLRRLDNVLFCTHSKDELAVRTWKYLKKETIIPKSNFNLAILSESEGTGFPHYWFYKLEFVLWFTQRTLYPKWNNFYLTTKNSIEHVSPQAGRDEDGQKVTKKTMNKFGNLALVTRSLNSELGNKEFNVKRDHFLNNRDNVGKIESLKLDLIFQSKFWNDRLCQEHETEMIKIISNYLEQEI